MNRKLLSYFFLIGSIIFWASPTVFAQRTSTTSVQNTAGGSGEAGSTTLLFSTAGQFSPPDTGLSGKISLLGGLIYTINNSPIADNSIPNQNLTKGGSPFTRNLNASPRIFSDPDGDPLEYMARSSTPNKASATISGNMLIVSPIDTVTKPIIITVMADDRLGGMDSTRFFITVGIEPNQSPVVADSIKDQSLTVKGESFSRDLKALPSVFTDPDVGDTLTYLASQSASNITMAKISNNRTLLVTPIAVGIDTITVTANDNSAGSVQDKFIVTVSLPAYPATLNLNTTVTYPSRSSASDYPATDYRIIGLPGASNRSVRDFLSGDQNKGWQVYRDNGAASDFFKVFDGSSDFQFATGRAFWVISKTAFSVNTTAPSASLNTMQEIQFPLQNGWNLITNPFILPVLWSQIQAANSITEPIWVFNGSFSQVDTFKTYAGYYFFNDTNLTLLKIPYILYFSGSSGSAEAVSPNWRVHISLSTGKFNEQAASFGVSSKASYGLDVFDFRKPRALAATPTVEFKRPTWDAKYSVFATDIRPEFEESESWEFDVRAISRQPAQLTFANVSKIPGRFEAYLIDANHAQSVNLREDSLYHFTPAAELMKFKVVVGRKENVQEQLNSLALPKDFALGPNYPNPFNPTTTIPVAIPAAAEIKLKIYNLLGAEIKTLYNGTIAAGRYSFNWDGRNELGNQVATGVYLYRLTTSKGVSLLGKMILMR